MYWDREGTYREKNLSRAYEVASRYHEEGNTATVRCNGSKETWYFKSSTAQTKVGSWLTRTCRDTRSRWSLKLIHSFLTILHVFLFF